MDILIEEQDGGLWAAALENGRLEGLEIDPPSEEVRWGSIYWAKVKTIDAALDAAFLDLDGDNTGILYNKDIRRHVRGGAIAKGGADAIGKTLSPGDMVAVQAKTAYMPREQDDYARTESKIPQVSMDITLQGRYLIFCAMMQENRLSSRIREKALRKQLQGMMDDLADMSGIILRSAAADMQTDMLRREGAILKEAWKQMQVHLAGAEPALIMLGPDAFQRMLSDQAGERISRIEVVTMDHFSMAEEWCSVFAPDLVPKIEPVEIRGAVEDLALFHYRDIVGQIEDLLRSYVLLPSGGNVIIQETAALTAIDVNKGGDRRSNLAVNLEAAQEIARQVRLRNIGGILLIDFLKFQSKKDENRVTETLEEVIRHDPCTVQIHGLTHAGLTELTRARRIPSLAERLDAEAIL
ncbi:MAG: ribonuclease E/G [Alphaproteobacteria bacterium]|nr:ribonuclease E/G [Alphaproteobacteria bacterium]